MNEQMTHPDPEQLAAYGLGKLEDAASDEIYQHLEACDSCRAAVEVLPDDTLASMVRASATVVNERGQSRQDLGSSANGTPRGTAADGDSPRPEQTSAYNPADSPPATDPSSNLGADTLTIPGPLIDHPRYRVLDLLGAGGMGSVYKAEHQLMGRLVALKVINPKLVDRPGMVERFQREVKAAARLAHPNIATAHDAEQAGDTHFLVMEFIEGQSLADLVARQGPLPVAQACDYVRQAALGLQHAYQRGMVHRDIKPQNLMLTPEGQVKILDFGLSHFVSESVPAESLTDPGSVMGTPDYIAPEQARDAHRADIRADIYSLGCTLYFLLSGQAPFPEGTSLNKITAHLERTPRPLPELRRDVPTTLASVLERMMAKDPARRYQTPGEVADALALFVSSAPTPVQPPRRRRPLVAALVLLGALGLGGYQFGPTVYRIATNKGQLVIATDDPDVEVIVKQGGDLVKIVDPKTSREITLAAGKYQLELAEGKEGLKLSTDQFVLERGGREIVRVRLEPAPAGAVPAVQVMGPVRSFEGHTGVVNCVTFSPNGRLALSGSDDGTVRLWDVATGKEVRRFEGHSNSVESVAFSPDGQQILSGSKDKTMRLWGVETGKELRRFTGHQDWVLSVAFSPDGRQALSGSGTRFSTTKDFTVRLWDVAGARELRRFEGHGGMVFSVAFSPDGRQALSGSDDETMRLWDVETGKEVRRFQGHHWGIWSVAFSPDSRQALSGGWDGTLRLWDLDGGKELRRFVGHTAQVVGVAFSPDGHRAVSCSFDKTVRLWDVADGQEVSGFTGHGDGVRSVAFSPDGRSALSGGGAEWKNDDWVSGRDFAIRLWALTPADPEQRSKVTKPSSEPAALPATGMDEAWIKIVVALPAESQVEEVARKLQELNPGFDGKLTPYITNGMVWRLDLTTNHVTTISPVRALKGLRQLCCAGTEGGKGILTDLEPLKGLSLDMLICGNNPRLTDLSPLRGMPLRALFCVNTQVYDLTPLTGMPLTLLHVGNTRVHDLSPLKGMPLEILHCFSARVHDLAPLKDLPLKEVKLDFQPGRDAEILRSIKTLETINGKPAKEFWKDVDAEAPRSSK